MFADPQLSVTSRLGPLDPTYVPKRYKVRVLGWLLAFSVWNILLGMGVMGTQIAAMVLYLEYNVTSSTTYDYDKIASGIWCGVICIVAGCVGCAASATNRNKPILVTTAVFSALSLACSVASGVLGAASARGGTRPEDCAYNHIVDHCKSWEDLQWSMVGCSIAALVNNIVTIGIASAESAAFKLKVQLSMYLRSAVSSQKAQRQSTLEQSAAVATPCVVNPSLTTTKQEVVIQPMALPVTPIAQLSPSIAQQRIAEVAQPQSTVASQGPVPEIVHQIPTNLEVEDRNSSKTVQSPVQIHESKDAKAHPKVTIVPPAEDAEPETEEGGQEEEELIDLADESDREKGDSDSMKPLGDEQSTKEEIPDEPHSDAENNYNRGQC